MKLTRLLALATICAACRGPGPLEVTGSPSRTIEVEVDQDIRINGTAIVRLAHTSNGSMVEDTIVVR